jgi:hypothetical protein
MVKMKNAYKIVIEKTDDSRHLGRPRRRWKDNFKMARLL